MSRLKFHSSQEVLWVPLLYHQSRLLVPTWACLISREESKCGIAARCEGWLGSQPELGLNPKFPVICPWISHLTSLSFKFFIYTMNHFSNTSQRIQSSKEVKRQIKQGISNLHPMGQNQHTVYFCKSSCIGI